MSYEMAIACKKNKGGQEKPSSSLCFQEYVTDLDFSEHVVNLIVRNLKLWLRNVLLQECDDGVKV